MGIFDKIGGVFGIGSQGTPDPHTVDSSYSDPLYQKGIAGINGASNPTKKLSNDINASAQGMLDNLQNNAAGLKGQFLEDSSRGFEADLQDRARVAGGTGNMAQAMMAPGSMYDSHARANAAGINQINAMAPGQLGQLTGVQNDLFNQNLNQANSAAHMYASQAGAGNAMQGQNAQQMIGSDAAGSSRLRGTLGSAAGFAAGMPGGMAKGGRVGHELEKHARSRLDERHPGPHSVPGKPKVPGNSPKNDTVPAWLSPDEIVIPNSVTHSSDPAGNGADFIQKTMENEGGKIGKLKEKAMYDMGGGVGEDYVSSAPGYAYGGDIIPAGDMGFYGGQAPNLKGMMPGKNKSGGGPQEMGQLPELGQMAGGAGDAAPAAGGLEGLAPLAMAASNGGKVEKLKRRALAGMKGA